MVLKQETINGIIQPLENGTLAKGAFGLTYKGVLFDALKTEVAIKFTPLTNREKAETEYEMYWYLDAVNNTDVEKNGIPAVYYYGTWNDYMVMAITLLDSVSDKHKLNDVDVLIIAREFVS